MALIDVSRDVNKKTLDLEVKVLTPMFLGGSTGDAELRSAPFKAALRYWWRIFKGAIDYNRLLQEETELFGGVKTDTVKSKVEVLASGFVKKEKPDMKNLKKVGHPEAERASHKVHGPGYLAGMGLYNFNRGFIKEAISPGEKFNLRVKCPEENTQDIIETLTLISSFGTLGSRSRNGYGSISFDKLEGFNSKDDSILDFAEVIRKEQNPYPHCLTKDDKGLLLWRLKKNDISEYGEILRELADIYIRLRTSSFFKFRGMGPGERHLLGYPIMNHNIREWGNGRLPSQLRLMVKPEQNGRLNGFFLHIAHPLPSDKKWFTHLEKQEKVWQKVHEFLDKNMQRVTI